jgi:glycosyltransferase involved in cell wall biosynthesis
MRIGIDARMWDESGIGRYLRNLVYELGKIDNKNDYYLFLLKKNKDISIPNNFIKVEADIGWYGASEQIRFPKLLNSYKLDLVHFPHFNVPFFYRGRFIVTIHDLIHQHFNLNRSTTLNPVLHKVKKIGYSQVFSHAVSHAQRIITPSEYVKKELEDTWNVDQDKIFVTHEGVDDNIVNLNKIYSPVTFETLKNKFNISGEYLFYVGNAHPHKNIDRLIRVFEELNRNYPNLKLVLSGKNNYFWEQAIKDLPEEMKHNLIYTGFITESELVALYKNCLAYIFPSLEEGFGIPMLEAFECGAPVVASKIGTLKEVGKDACLYFDPENEQDMIKTIKRVIDASELRKELVKKGKKRVMDFSWEKLANQTLEIYRSVK